MTGGRPFPPSRSRLPGSIPAHREPLVARSSQSAADLTSTVLEQVQDGVEEVSGMLVAVQRHPLRRWPSE